MNLTITVLDDCFQIGETVFDGPAPLARFKITLGESRSWKPEATAAISPQATIHTFDQAGIWAYEEHGVVSQISILMSEPHPRIRFHPTKVFGGDLVIRGTKITRADDFFGVEREEVHVDEWETEGVASIDLERVKCDIVGNSKSMKIESISVWYP